MTKEETVTEVEHNIKHNRYQITLGDMSVWVIPEEKRVAISVKDKETLEFFRKITGSSLKYQGGNHREYNSSFSWK